MRKRGTLSGLRLAIRLLTVASLTLWVAWLYARADPLATFLWLSAALLIGFVLDRWQTLAVAPIPWLIGISAAILTGDYQHLRHWEAVSEPIEGVRSLAIGLFGIAVGLGLRRWNRSPG
jgi:hypothetical protein